MTDRNQALRDALAKLINAVQDWCDAVQKDSSWDGWDHHYKKVSWELLPEIREQLALATQEPASERCPSCNGSGLQLNMAGEPDECRECKGDTVVPASEPNDKLRELYRRGQQIERDGLPASEPIMCDCERSANGLGLAGRECDCPASEPAPASADCCGWEEVLDTFIAKWRLQSRNSRCSEDESVADNLVKGALEIKEALRARAQPCRCGELEATLTGVRTAIVSTLCDPEGNPCFEGSDGDRDIIREVLAQIDAALSRSGTENAR